MNSFSKAKMRARKIIREKLADYNKEQLISKGRAVVDKLSGIDAFAKAHTLMLYVSLNREVATHDLICKLLASGKRVLVPCCGSDGKMEAVEIKDFARDLSPGYKGILEPRGLNCQVFDPLSVDVLIAPVVGFSATRYRLGQGKGFYDRFVNRLSDQCLKIGLAFECQRLDDIPVAAHDARLDMIVTELEIYTDKIKTR